MADRLNVRVELYGDALNKFTKIQTRLGIESATDVVRFLINDYYYKNIEQDAQKPAPTKPAVIE